MTLDLRVAMNCIGEQKKNKTYDGAKIGIVKKGFGDLCSYNAGSVILFKDEGDNHYTVETPLSSIEILKQKKNKSLITTVKTTVGVPSKYIDEVKF
jgi:hypothetical protein